VTDPLQNIQDFRFAVLVCVIDALCAARSIEFTHFLCALNGLLSDFARPLRRHVGLSNAVSWLLTKHDRAPCADRAAILPARVVPWSRWPTLPRPAGVSFL
jgi:hypothetical protein